MPRADLDELERHACPGPGTCAGHFTANTMAVALDRLGIAPIGDGLIPADESDAKDEAATRAGARRAARRAGGDGAAVPRPARAPERDGRDRPERRLDERDPAPARDRTRGGTPLSLADLAALAQRTPVLASLAPAGPFMAADFHRAGGTASLIRELVRGGHVDGLGADGRGPDARRGDRREPPRPTARCS